MTVGELKKNLACVDDALDVCVIFNGEIDKEPELNVEEGTLYIEGVGEELKGGAQ